MDSIRCACLCFCLRDPDGLLSSPLHGMIVNERAFDFVGLNPRSSKPRTRGITEVRGPYRTVMGKRYFADLFETVGHYVDSIEFMGGSFILMSRPALSDIIELAHAHAVQVSTGGFIEYVLTQGPDAVDRYIFECGNVGFDSILVSTGYITMSIDDWLRLISKIQRAGLEAQAEIGIMCHGASPESRGARSGWAVQQAERLIDAGASRVIFEANGMTDGDGWRGDVVGTIIGQLGIERVMFVAVEPEVFTWYVQNFGPEVNLFIDPSQVLQLETLRSGIWGPSGAWGRIVGYGG